MKQPILQIIKAAFALAVLCFSCAFFAAAQEETNATVTGQIVDPSGAIIANATVVVTNTATNVERRTQSNKDGGYTVFPLTPGSYTVTVEQSGFKKYVQNITLSAKDRRPVQIQLEIGSPTETVTVTTEPPLVQDSSTGQALIDGRQVVELPLNNRNFIRLVETVPGVSSDLDDESSFGLTSRASISVNGLRRNAVNYLVDGVSNTDVGSNITLLSTPTVDSIQEFKVLSSNYTAEIGRSGGGVVSIVTRGGGNRYAGNLYEFVRNDYFNANSFFNNRLGRRADGTLVAGVPKLRYNNFGGTFSGPVLLPKFGEGGKPYYYGKNKTFFFFSEEVRRIKRGVSDSSGTVPTAQERVGDFSQTPLGSFLCRGNAAPFTVSTSATANSCAAGTTPVQVQTNTGTTIQAQQNQIFNPRTGLAYVGNIIPTSDIDPRARGLLQAYPLANNGLRGLTFTPVNINNTRQEVIRIDHNFNDNHKIFGRYTQDRSDTQESGGLFTGISLPGVAVTNTGVPGKVFAVNYTGIFTNALVNEFSYNYSTNTIVSQLVGRGRRADYPNAGGIAEVFPENTANAIPTVTITGLTTVGALQGFNIKYGNHTFRDVLSYTRGNHIFKFGGEITFESKNENAGSNTQGTFAFGVTQTQGRIAIAGTTPQTFVQLTGTGNSFASYLLGYAGSYSEANTDITVREKFGRREFFAQDTWKIRPNLTLDLGVRYQYFLPVIDRNNTLASFDPALYARPDPNAVCVNAANCTAFNATGGNALNPLLGIGVAGSTSRFGRSISPSDKNNFSPRVGIAYDPFNNGKTIIRAGYGFYYDQPLVGVFEQAAFTTPPFSTIPTYTTIVGDINQTVSFSNPSAGTAPGTIPTRSVIAIANNFSTPETQVYSLGIQREVFKNALLDVSYVGTKGDKLIRRRNINFLTPQQLNGRVNAANADRPFLGYSTVTYIETSARSRYNGLLSSFNYRFGKGFTFTAAYTFSKTLTDSTNDRDAIDDPQNPFNTRLEYAEARTSRPHVFNASYVYELPFFVKSSNALARTLLGGYQISGITQIESGAPVPRVAVADTLSGQRGLYPNLVGNPRGGLTGTIDPATGLPFIFDPTAFAPAANGTFGNAGRSFARLPGRNQTNLALAKQFYFNTERTMYVQLRAEGFNVFNQTQFVLAAGNATTLPTAGALSNTLFARPTGTRPPREFQFGAKLYF